MIDALDHLVLGGSAGVYETLLGRRAADGRLQTGNVGLVFAGGGATGLASMVFATSALDEAATLLERRGVPGERNGGHLVLSRAATHEVPIELVERTEPAPASPLLADEAAVVSALDHVVIRTPNPERAIAFYAGRLGLEPAARSQQSRVGRAAAVLPLRRTVVEIAHDLKKGVSDGPDQLWGLSWRVPDIAKANARLKAAGVDVTEPRDGRRPGSQVFTVKSHTEGVPTIVIGGIGRWS